MEVVGSTGSIEFEIVIVFYTIMKIFYLLLILILRLKSRESVHFDN